MKRFLSFSLITSLFISLMGTGALAQTSPFSEIQDHLINDPFLVVNYQGATSNLINQFSSGVIDMMESDNKEQAELFQSMFLENNVTAVVGQPQKNENDTIFYLVVDTSETSLTDAVATIKSIEALETTEYQGYTIYSSYKRADFAATYTNGVVLVSDSVNRLKLALDNITPNSNVTSLYSHIPNDSFLSFIFNPEVSATDFPELAGISNSYEHQVISISETATDEFTMTSYSKGNTTTFDSHDLNYQDYVFTPTLHNTLPGENTLLYAEMHNVYDFITKTIEVTETAESLGSEYNEMLALLAPYKDVLNGNTAFSVQLPEGTFIPYINVVTEVNSQNTAETLAAENLTTFLSAQIDTELENEGLTPADITTTNGSLVTKDFSSLLGEEQTVKLTYGQTNDYYLISNNPNITTELNGANTLANNTEFTSNINATLPNGLNSEVAAVTYFAPATLTGLIDYVVGYYSENLNLDAEEQSELNKVTTFLNNLQPWVGYSTPNGKYEMTEVAKMALPLNSLVDLLLESAGEELARSQATPSYQHEYQFSDVDFNNFQNLWYGEALINLANDDIVKGSNGEFLPANAITRAEYITMLVRYYNLDGDCLGSNQFSDVEAGAWYDANICTAYQHGLIKGDDNGNTVRPNDPINRAEATQILANFSGVLAEADATNAFNDVANNAWYAEAVGKAYNKEIVKGRTADSFAPSAQLNRAEAAVLINRVRDKEVRFFRLINSQL